MVEVSVAGGDYKLVMRMLNFGELFREFVNGTAHPKHRMLTFDFLAIVSKTGLNMRIRRVWFHTSNIPKIAVKVKWAGLSDTATSVYLCYTSRDTKGAEPFGSNPLRAPDLFYFEI